MLNDKLAALAASMLVVRENRRALFGNDLFGAEQAWDMLLTLFVADARSEPLTGGETVERSGGSIETGRRWMIVLTRKHLIVGDGDGNLDDGLTLTPRGLDLLETWLRRASLTLTRSANGAHL